MGYRSLGLWPLLVNETCFGSVTAWRENALSQGKNKSNLHFGYFVFLHWNIFNNFFFFETKKSLKKRMIWEYNIRHHYWTRHAEEYAKSQGDERKDRVTRLKLKRHKRILLFVTQMFQIGNKSPPLQVFTSFYGLILTWDAHGAAQAIETAAHWVCPDLAAFNINPGAPHKVNERLQWEDGR